MSDKAVDENKAEDNGQVAGVKRPASSAGQDDTTKKIAVEEEKQAVKGGCHCGYVERTNQLPRTRTKLTVDNRKIRYTVNLKLNPDGGLNATRCNCTFCQKLSQTNVRISAPDEDFKLLKPDSKDELGDYSSTGEHVNGHRYFCPTCSVLVWSQGWYQTPTMKVEFFVLNASSIDQPQEGVELSKSNLQYFDALHDNFTAGTKDMPWEGGLI